MMSTKTSMLIMSVFALILSAIPASAVPQLPHSYAGKAYVGGVLAPQGSAIRAVAGTSGVDWNTTVANTAGDWTLDITFDDTDTAGTREGMSAGETVTWYLRTVQARTSSPSTGSTTSDFDLNISASCSDSLQNGDETGVDCGGSCPLACYAMTAALTSSSVNVPSNSSGTTVLTITNTGKNTLAGIAVSVPVFSPSQGSIAITFTAPSATLTSGSHVNVTLTINVGVNTTENTFSGAINVSATNVTTQQVTIYIDTSTAAVGVGRTARRIEISAAGLEGAPICLGQPVVIKAVDERRGTVVDGAHVVVYLGEEVVKNKLFYGDTNDKGEYQFTPTKEGDYLITVTATRYRKADLKVSVKSCVAETTTVPATTTTKAPAVTTTTQPKYTTSTVPVTTTIKVVTTTVYKPVTTTVPYVPPAPPAKKTPWGTIIAVIVVVVIIAAFLSMKKKGGAAPSAEKPKEEGK